jgi:hypothetical protein
MENMTSFQTVIIIQAEMPQFNQCVCPLWISDQGGSELIGSGTLLKIEQATFLITAAHVIDSAENQPLLVGDLNQTKPIGGHGKQTRPASGSRHDDRNDTAVIALDEETTEFLEARYQPLPVWYVDAIDSLLPQKPYAFFGFPWRKAGKKSYGFQANSVSEADYISIGLSPQKHIAVEFNLKHADDEDGRDVVAPNPQGMSGGPIWNFATVNLDGQQVMTRKLVGIAIEYVPGRRLLVGVRINAALECIRMMSPNLSPSIPTNPDLVVICTNHSYE